MRHAAPGSVRQHGFPAGRAHLSHTFQWEFGHSSMHCIHSSMRLNGFPMRSLFNGFRQFFDAFSGIWPFVDWPFHGTVKTDD